MLKNDCLAKHFMDEKFNVVKFVMKIKVPSSGNEINDYKRLG
jgi:hypothetical protein